MKQKFLLLAIIIVVIVAGGTYVALNPSILTTLQQTDLTISWTTESELDIIGFNLYRSDTPDGEFLQINTEVVPPADDPFIGGEHMFIDEGVVRGQTYYYQLETINRTGSTSIEGPFAITAE